MRGQRLILIVALAAPVMLGIGAVAFRMWGSTRPAVSIRELRDVPVGTTQDEIKRRFGPPQNVHDLYGDHRWCYYRTNGTTIVYMIFDRNGRYAGYELDD